MGNTLTQEQKKATQTACSNRFTEKEIGFMLTHFRNIGHKSSKKPCSDIDLNVEMNEGEFSRALGFDSESYMLGRFFKIFDANGDGKINFQEFLKALSFLCDKATTAEKIKFSFRLYDVDCDGKISKEELLQVFKASVESFPHKFTSAELNIIVERTFEELAVAEAGFISFEEYSRLASSHPMMLQQMTLDISSVMKNMPQAHKYAKKHPELTEEAGLVASAAAASAAT